jgi:hypothetical protein
VDVGCGVVVVGTDSTTTEEGTDVGFSIPSPAVVGCVDVDVDCDVGKGMRLAGGNKLGGGASRSGKSAHGKVGGFDVGDCSIWVGALSLVGKKSSGAEVGMRGSTQGKVGFGVGTVGA